MSKEINISALIQGYDEVMFNRVYEYLNYGDFMNYGYWEEGVNNTNEACENLMEKLLSFIPDKRGNILDVACGKGATTRYLLKYYGSQHITGINISEVQLETAKMNAPGCTFLVMNATNLEFNDSSFDAIICVEAAFHFHTREKFFNEAHRVLKPSGYLVLSDILMNMEGEKRRRFRTEENYVKDLEEYGKVLRKVGFQKVEVVDATEPCWKGHFWNVVRRLHGKFLKKEIDKADLSTMLRNTIYRNVSDIEYYLLAMAQKG